MTLSARETSDLRRLIVKSCEGQLTGEEEPQLKSWLTDSGEARQIFAGYSAILALLELEIPAIVCDECGMMDDYRTEVGIGEQHSVDVKFADTPHSVILNHPSSHPSLGFLSSAYRGTVGYFSHELPLSMLIATVIMASVLYVAWLFNISHHQQLAEHTPNIHEKYFNPETVCVGRITGMKDCRWAKPNTQTVLGASVSLERKYALSSGLMEITYISGAKVILEGPCTFKVDSNAGGFLGRGKLTANIRGQKTKVRGQRSGIGNQKSPNPQSLIHDPFVIHTPTAIVTDLGTEFGVEVSENGDTTSYVFRGSVRMRAICDGRQDEVELRADELARIKKWKDNDFQLLVGAEAGKSPEFVRRIYKPPTKIDLLDVVAGGNGAGRRRDYGIDPSTGLQDPQFLPGERLSDGKYHYCTPYTKMIDGVFIPNPSLGPVQLDSAGHTYRDFPQQSDGGTFGAIWSRAARVQPRENWSPNPDFHYWIYTANFDDGFMPEKRGLLGMHANAGITFDLAAIRSVHGGQRSLTCFRAMAGKARNSLAEMLVFVDGRLAWRSGVISDQSGVKRVEVPIHSTDRFLTLVTIEASDGRGSDWTVFGDPVLECLDSDRENK